MRLIKDVPGLTFEKAASVELSDAVANWPHEITEQLHKKFPFLSDHKIDIRLDHSDEETGAGVGAAVVYSGSKMIKVGMPLIIRNRRMAPADVMYVKDTPMPATKARLQGALFEPQAGDAVKKPKGDTSISAETWPPYRTRHDGSPAANVNVKVGHVVRNPEPSPSLLQKIALTVPRGQAEALLKKVASSDAVRWAFRRHPESAEVLRRVATMASLAPTKLASIRRAKVDPTVYQLSKVAGVYRLRISNPECYFPLTKELTRLEAEKLASPEIISAVDRSGRLMMSTAPGVGPVQSGEAETITRFGHHRVKTHEGRNLVGWCFPTVLSYEMVQLPLMLFTNGSEFAVQDKIVGEFMGPGGNFPDEKPELLGTFLYRRGQGALATLPILIQGSVADGWTGILYGENRPIVIKKVSGVARIIKIDASTYALPEELTFLRLRNKTSLMGDKDLFIKTSAQDPRTTAEIITDGILYSFRGPVVEKLASEQTGFLNRSEAEFLCANLGLSSEDAVHTLDNANLFGSVKLGGLRTIIPEAEVVQATLEPARKAVADTKSLRRELIKEAASVAYDGETVDQLLALNFINPENVAAFVDYIPEFKKTASKISELLLASRLGLSDVPEDALTTLNRNLDFVIRGLEVLEHNYGE